MQTKAELLEHYSRFTRVDLGFMRWAHAFAIWWVGTLFPFAFLLIISFHDDRFTLILTVSAISIITLWLTSFMEFRRFNERLANRDFMIQLPETFRDPIETDVQEISKLLRYDRPINILCEANSGRIAAFACRKREDDIVVLSLGFLKYYRDKKHCAKAILAHEVAHLRQGDGGVLVALSTYRKWYLRIAPAFGVALVGMVWMAGFESGTHPFLVAGIAFLGGSLLVWRLKDHRKIAERFADFAALLSCETSTHLLEAIRDTATSPFLENSFNPSANWRIHQIEKMVTKFPTLK